MKYPALIKAIDSASSQLQSRAAVAVNQALVLRNWLVGAWIVEYEQNGKDRAKHGARLLPTLAADLAVKGVKGLGARTLRDCATFYSLYPRIRQQAVAQFGEPGGNLILQPPVAKLTQEEEGMNLATTGCKISKPMVGELPTPLELEQLARITWAHFLELIRMDDPWKRAFYENELLKGHWSKRQLQRQIGSLLYERTGLSIDEKAVIERARKQESKETFNDLIRDPYVLEFTGLAERPEYSEDELESALLDHVQMFLLELGRGFCFEARQFRMTEGRKHHRVDLVFYHRILRCHVLIELKIRAFKPTDAGQMNFYVNWCKANMMSAGDNPPVGISCAVTKTAQRLNSPPPAWMRSSSFPATSSPCRPPKNSAHSCRPTARAWSLSRPSHSQKRNQPRGKMAHNHPRSLICLLHSTSFHHLLKISPTKCQTNH